MESKRERERERGRRKTETERERGLKKGPHEYWMQPFEKSRPFVTSRG